MYWWACNDAFTITCLEMCKTAQLLIYSASLVIEIYQIMQKQKPRTVIEQTIEGKVYYTFVKDHPFHADFF